MTVDEIIVATLTPVIPDIASGTYTGGAAEYITFDYYTRPTTFGDDKPEFELYRIQIHLVAPVGTNILAKRRQIKNLLFAADFTYPDEIPGSDGAEQHYVYECEYIMPTEV